MTIRNPLPKCAMACLAAAVIATMATTSAFGQQPAGAGKRSFFGISTDGPGTSPERVAEFEMRVNRVNEVAREGDAAEALRLLKQVRADLPSDVKVTGLDELQRGLEHRLGLDKKPQPKPQPTPQPKPQPLPPAASTPRRTLAPPKIVPLTKEYAKIADQCEQMIRLGKYRTAYPNVMELRHRLGPARNPRVEGMLAEMAMIEKATRRAANFIEPFVQDHKSYGDDRFNCFLQDGYVNIASHRVAQAASNLDWLAAKENDRHLNQALALEALGIARMDLKQWAPAIKALKFALYDIQAQAHDLAYYEKPKDPFLKTLRSRLEHRLAIAQHEQEIALYGPDYFKLVAADKLRLGGDFPKAYEAYAALVKESPDSPYSEAARYYIPVCMFEAGGVKQAEKTFQDFYESNPYGPYRGEALLQMGRIALQEHLDPKLATQRFDLLQAWLKEVRKPERKLPYPPVFSAAVKITKPGASKYTKDFWGNIKLVPIAPGQLFDRSTCSWYLDDLECRAAKYFVFIAMVNHQKEQAQVALNRLLNLDPTMKAMNAAGEWTDFKRLQFGIDHGYLVAYPQELRLYNDKQRFVIKLGDFYYVTQQFKQARRHFQNMLDGKYGALSSAQRDYAYYAIGGTLLRQHSSTRQVIAEYEEVLREHDSTWTEYRAAYSIANLSRYVASGDIRQRGDSLLLSLAKSPVSNEFTIKSRIMVSGEYAKNNNMLQAIRWLQMVHASDSGCYQLAQNLISKYRCRLNTKLPFAGRSDHP